MGFKMVTLFSLLLLSSSSTSIISAHSAATHHHPPLCHENESSALLQFKQDFFINHSASIDAVTDAGFPPNHVYPKTLSWKNNNNNNNSSHGEKGGDCCLWDGVECDDNTGQVIGLNLSASCLYGSIHSSSPLFRLLHLQSLDLSFNHFNYSTIPSELGRLSRLKHLNLSASSFSGQIPSQISGLSELVSLLLYGNPLLSLPPTPGLGGLARNLTSLQNLNLTQVNISSTVPDSFANLSSLVSLFLENCSLSGQFPPNIFNLPNIRSLRLRYNPNLKGVLPEFKRGSPLRELRVTGTGFGGEIPKSIGNLNSLIWLGLGACQFQGSIPESLSNLTQLTALWLPYNNFKGVSLPSWIGKLSQLVFLDVGWTNLGGRIPASLANLTRLIYLSLTFNRLEGTIPPRLGNLTRLRYLDFRYNQLQGPIPDSIFDLGEIVYLDLSANGLSGSVEFEKFIGLRNLQVLTLSWNKLSLLINTPVRNATFPNFGFLGLASCNLSRFPDFLRGQHELRGLELNANNIGGLVPKWVWNLSLKTLSGLGLFNNSLIGFEQSPILLPWERLQVLVLSSNKFRGPLPIPPSSILIYQVSGNFFAGKIPPVLCSAENLQILDVSQNNLDGAIPDSFKSGSQLHLINLSRNKLQGPLPRSLVNCNMLEILDVSNNQFNDTFPSWLGILPELRILLLRSNQFHGIIGNFSVRPTEDEYFPHWKAMKISHTGNLTYMSLPFGFEIHVHNSGLNVWYVMALPFTVTVFNKGVQRLYVRVLDVFTVLDLSNNGFTGWIPESIGDLTGLHSLNLSNNVIVGSIPPSFGKLTDLESLDLSHNKLWGHIPEQLTQLTFLEVLNVSYNNLSGSIPHGKQLDTFQNDSYMGNSRLCGDPLPRKCGILTGPSTTVVEEKESENVVEFVWIVMCMGFVGGLVVGVIIGTTLATHMHEWFFHTFGRWLSL